MGTSQRDCSQDSAPGSPVFKRERCPKATEVRRKERGLCPEQKSLLDETFDIDLAAVARDIEDAQPKKPDGEMHQPKRAPLPARLPRQDLHHAPRPQLAALPRFLEGHRDLVNANGVARQETATPFNFSDRILR